MSCVSSFPKPPSYYKKFEASPTSLTPPHPMKGEFFSNGYIRNLDTPIVDYVDPGHKYLFNKDEFVHNGNAKAEAAHS